MMTVMSDDDNKNKNKNKYFIDLNRNTFEYCSSLVLPFKQKKRKSLTLIVHAIYDIYNYNY